MTGATTTAATAAPPRSTRWIVGPAADLLFIIGTPLLVWTLLTAARLAWTPAAITSFALVWAIGHHLPGMMRAYGDAALFRRFRVRFLVAPLVVAAVGVYSTVSRSSAVPLGVGLWGLWHYLMQAYGFLRIYDGKAGSGDRVTGLLDQAMCLVWFGAAGLLPDNGLFADLHLFYKAGGPIAPEGLIIAIRRVALVLVVGVTAAFVVHSVRRAREGRPPSLLKLALMATTFGYYWYSLAAGSSLLVSYALFELFHDAQYLTIVWAFNERRAGRDAGAGAFTRFLFRRRGWLIAAYLGLIVAYGSLNLATRRMDDGVTQRVLLGLFTASTLLHYYYDGFIWKLREAETGQPLGLMTTTTSSPRRPLRGLAWTATAALAAFVGFMAWRERQPETPAATLEKQSSLAHLLPGSAFAQHNHGIALAAAGRLDEAEAALRRALVLSPDFAEVHYNLGGVLLRKGAADEARKEYLQAATLDPDHVEANYNLGVLELARRRPVDAIERLEAALRRSRPRAEIHASLGAALAAAGRRDAASVQLHAALALRPDLVEAHSALASVLAANRDFGGALAHYRRAVDFQPRATSTRLALAAFLENQGRLSEAEAEYLAAVEVDPQSAAAWNGLGTARARQNRIAEAADAFQRALDIAPRDAIARQNLERAQALLKSPPDERP